MTLEELFVTIFYTKVLFYRGDVMAKKKSAFSEAGVAEKANSALAKRLRELVTDPGALAKKLDCTTQAVNQYKQGMARPQVDKLEIIADTYGVSVDYLLGRTDVASLDLDMANACAYTGLTEEAVNALRTLHKNCRNMPYMSTVCDIICHKDFPSLVHRCSVLNLSAEDASIDALNNSFARGMEDAFATGNTEAILEATCRNADAASQNMMFTKVERYDMHEIAKKLLDDCCRYEKLMKCDEAAFERYEKIAEEFGGDAED